MLSKNMNFSYSIYILLYSIIDLSAKRSHASENETVWRFYSLFVTMMILRLKVINEFIYFLFAFFLFVCCLFVYYYCIIILLFFVKI